MWKKIIAGITPAGAGKTNSVFRCKFGCRDHPRRCGENPIPEVACCKPQGSPPQVRGKHVLHIACSVQTRITPAGAGKTSTVCGTGSPASDHPRRCGENLLVLLLMMVLPGSPPQVRGKHAAAIRPTVLPGITPAGAGKTSGVAGRSDGSEDHPRRCGENLFAG